MRRSILFAACLAGAFYASNVTVSGQFQSCATSGSFTQGQRSCTVFAETKCANVGCGSISKGTCTLCDETQASTNYTATLCESTVPAGCTVDTAASLHCSNDKSAASFGYHCSDGAEGVRTSTNITCPIQCQNCSDHERVNDADNTCVACPFPQVAFEGQSDDWRHCHCPVDTLPDSSGRCARGEYKTATGCCLPLSRIASNGECQEAGGYWNFSNNTCE